MMIVWTKIIIGLSVLALLLVTVVMSFADSSKGSGGLDPSGGQKTLDEIPIETVELAIVVYLNIRFDGEHSIRINKLTPLDIAADTYDIVLTYYPFESSDRGKTATGTAVIRVDMDRPVVVSIDFDDDQPIQSVKKIMTNV